MNMGKEKMITSKFPKPSEAAAAAQARNNR
jgi:hypothetical protein